MATRARDPSRPRRTPFLTPHACVMASCSWRGVRGLCGLRRANIFRLFRSTAPPPVMSGCKDRAIGARHDPMPIAHIRGPAPFDSRRSHGFIRVTWGSTRTRLLRVSAPCPTHYGASMHRSVGNYLDVCSYETTVTGGQLTAPGGNPRASHSTHTGARRAMEYSPDWPESSPASVLRVDEESCSIV